MSINTPFTAVKVGEISPLQLEYLGQPTAGLHVTSTGISAVIADRWSQEQLASRERLPVHLSRYKNLTVLSLRFRDGSNRGLSVDLPHADLLGTPNHWQPPEHLTPNSRLLITVVYVDQYSARVLRVRGLTLDPATTKHLIAALKHQQNHPLSPTEYLNRVADFYRKYPTDSAVRRNAMHRGYAGA